MKTAPKAKIPAPVEIRSFRDSDFYGFAGAEEFADGSQPLMCEHQFADGSGLCLVISKDLSCALFNDADGEPDEQTNYGGYLLDNHFKNADEAIAWFALVRSMLVSKESVLALGFKA